MGANAALPHAHERPGPARVDCAAPEALSIALVVDFRIFRSISSVLGPAACSVLFALSCVCAEALRAPWGPTQRCRMRTSAQAQQEWIVRLPRRYRLHWSWISEYFARSQVCSAPPPAQYFLRCRVCALKRCEHHGGQRSAGACARAPRPGWSGLRGSRGAMDCTCRGFPNISLDLKCARPRHVLSTFCTVVCVR